MAINSYIVLDLAKPTPTAVDLSSNFNGRVGDSQSFIKIWLKSHGLPQDLSDKNVFFAGTDPAAQPKKIYGTAKADQPGDNIQVGRVTFYFPRGTFQTEGDWDSDNTYFGVADADGNTVSAINVALHVLSNNVEMQVASKPFYTQLEKITSDGKQQIQDWLDQAKTKVTNALDAVLDPKSQLNTLLQTLKKELDAIQSQIDRDDFVSRVEFIDHKELIDGQIKQAIADINTIKNQLKIADTRDTNQAPKWYRDNKAQQVVTELKTTSALGISQAMLPNGENIGKYCSLTTEIPLSDNTCQPYQTAKLVNQTRPIILIRVGKSDTVWSEWELMTTW